MTGVDFGSLEVQAARSDSRGTLLVVRFGAGAGVNDGRVFLCFWRKEGARARQLGCILFRLAVCRYWYAASEMLTRGGVRGLEMDNSMVYNTITPHDKRAKQLLHNDAQPTGCSRRILDVPTFHHRNATAASHG